MISDNSYLHKPLAFKVKKVARYVRLYGVSPTLSKVRSQLHMQRDDRFNTERWENPACGTPDHPDRIVGLIGCGAFAYSIIAHYLRKRSGRFLRATFDIHSGRSRSLCKRYGGAYAAQNVDLIIHDPAIKLVYIASNHASHAEYAIEFLNAGKDVHIEKPQVVTEDQLERLIDAQRQNPQGKLFLGFNRPRSEHFKRIQTAFDQQSGPIMINWFIAGHDIPEDHWYFSEAEGGRVMGNLCHWTDLTLNLVGIALAYPCVIVPATKVGSRSDFCIGIQFGEGSVAGITFSAKGHTFEGVREVLNAHRGDALIELRDFKNSTIEVRDKKSQYTSWHRDHGHEANVLNSYDATLQDDASRAVTPEYNAATARLFLGVRSAVEAGQPLTVEPTGPIFA
jgi:predicted dehydrogenase